MKILIVDDETISRKLLLKKMARIGSCTAVDDSLEAMELFDKAVKAKAPFNLITLDVSMPKMDGKQLLSMIRKKEKVLKTPGKDRVKIIMVTSRMNMSTIKECIKLGCNGYLSKPVNTYQLLGNLGRIGLIPSDDIQKEDKNTHARIVARIIKRFYKGEIKLPVLPGIVTELQALKKSPDPSIMDLANIVKKDIVISSKLISIANSALYKGVDKIDNLNAALIRLGMKATYGLITTLVTKSFFKSDHKELNEILKKLWMHSFACACLGKRIAETVKIGKPETVFLMGIIHDIGKMLLMKAVIDMNPKENLNDPKLQLAVHEIHTTFGAVLLKQMRFSKEFIQIAEFHHWNDFSKQDEKELLVIHLSDFLAGRIGFGFFDIDQHDDKNKPDKTAALANLNSLKQLNLDPEKVMQTADEIKSVIMNSAAVF
ncbi:MAG: HDOD domain-containing protein [Proteobacteria bacterium]|nr:HDOD domain-containing protein [Pseudomonadota bacterium]